MKLTGQIAKNLREVFYGGNWTDVNLKDSLSEVTWKDATKSVGSLNTISSLVYHINYYLSAVLKVLQGGPLDAHDKDSFKCPEILSQLNWDKLKNKVFADVETLACLIEKLPEKQIWEDFTDNKYGNYYRNLIGIIEHTHYHL